MSPSKPIHWTRITLTTVVISLIVASGAVAWALYTVLDRPTDVLESAVGTYVTVREGTIGQSQRVNTVAKWAAQPIGINRATGVVTSVSTPTGAEVSSGSRVFDVGLRPVSIAEGATPSFRDIGIDSEGADVSQLQRMLSLLGYYRGSSDGAVGALTVEAIKDWQKSLKIPETGIVLAGDIIFVPHVPARITVDSELLFPGATLVGGEKVISILSTEPTFTIPLTANQAFSAGPGTAMIISGPDGQQWNAIAGEQKPHGDSGGVEIQITSADGNSICGDACVTIPVAGNVLLPSEILIVPTITGLVVPNAALKTEPDGTVIVIDDLSARHPVVVKAASQGESIITGVDVGLRVRLPFPIRTNK